MSKIIQITGNVKHTITLDPTLWIFDDRRIELNKYFKGEHTEKDEVTEYMKSMGKHWSREIMEGATFPPTLEAEKEFEQLKEITGTYGIFLHHFIGNASPNEDAKWIVFESEVGEEHSFPLSKLKEFILKYSIDGKPIVNDGPVHILLEDGSNIDEPITNVHRITIR